jgi:hypothetical protein
MDIKQNSVLSKAYIDKTVVDITYNEPFEEISSSVVPKILVPS